MTEKPVTKTTIAVLVAAFLLLFGALVWAATIEGEQDARRSCMENVPSPNPSSEFYDDQSLEFMSEIRKCLRG